MKDSEHVLHGDPALGLLKILSNPIRKTIIQSLEGNSMNFSDVMRECGLNPNYDTGPFYYHLSRLIDSGLVEKADDEYGLTDMGSTASALINTLQRESEFLLETESIDGKNGEKGMNHIEARWLTQTEAQHGEYGILMGGPRKTPVKPKPHTVPEDRAKNKALWEWRDSLPKIEAPLQAVPALLGNVLGFEKDGIKLGSIHVRFNTGRQRGLARAIAMANVFSIHVLDQNCRRIGEARASVLRKMM